jgi:hypothetical protein
MWGAIWPMTIPALQLRATVLTLMTLIDPWQIYSYLEMSTVLVEQF